MIQGQLNFSRDMEREADRIGFAVLNAAGYAPGGMVGMFEKLDGSSRLNDSGSYPSLRSHPLTFERQSEARLRLQGLPGQPAPGASTSSPWLHALMVARSRVLMDATAVSLRRLQDTPALRSGQGLAEQLAGLYTAALASSLLRDHATAERRGREARALLAAQPSPDPAAARALWLLDAEGRMAAGDHAGALRVLAQVREQWPATADARPVLLMQAQAALHLTGATRTDALRSSTEALQTWVAEHPRDAQAWLQLGNNADALGQRLRSLRAHAESRLLLGDLTGALDRLRSGRNLARSGVAGQDFIEVSIIDARLRELEAQRRQLLAEQRGRNPQRGGARSPEGRDDRNPDAAPSEGGEGSEPARKPDSPLAGRAIVQAALGGIGLP
jgi:predicted Zn-dependent protease